MRYFARVTAAFRADDVRPNTFEIWEILLALTCERPRQALEKAIADARKILDDPGNFRDMGYQREPCFYGVRSLHHDLALPATKTCCDSDGMIMLDLVATFDEAQMGRIMTFYDVQVPYQMSYID